MARDIRKAWIVECVIMEGRKKVLIIGGGFGGIACARALTRAYIASLEVTLVSDRPHFEYTPALYRVVSGRSPLGVCIRLREIFKGTAIRIVTDRITRVDIAERFATGSAGATYAFDYVVLALGSETAYFDIPGLEAFSFGIKSITQAEKLQGHLRGLFKTCAATPGDTPEGACRAHIVVVGGGASGVEIAGELAWYAKKLARQFGMNPALVTIDLVEAAPRILPMLPMRAAEKIAKRLRNLGVNIFTNCSVEKESTQDILVRGMTPRLLYTVASVASDATNTIVYTKGAGMKIKTDTVVWTAGVKPHVLYKEINGLSFDVRGRVLVDDFLQAIGTKGVYVIGDGAATPYTGMAQTALFEGRFIGLHLVRMMAGVRTLLYRPKKPYHAIPVGPEWACALLGPVIVCGRLGWMLRRAADFCYFYSLLPLRKALALFLSRNTPCEECDLCPSEAAVKKCFVRDEKI